MATISTLLFKVLGTTDEVTECEYCGRVDLKGTVVLALLDVDGNREGTAYYGTTCAAKAGKRTVKSIREDVKAAERKAREDRLAKQEAESREFIARRDEWIAANIGADALSSPRKYGFSGPVAVVQAYLEACGGW